MSVLRTGAVMSDFQTAYPDYSATSRVDELRAAEYPYLDADGHVYLDYTGAGLVADAQLRAHTGRLRGGCFGNPHSDSPASTASTRLVDQARDAILRYFNASPDEYAVIFTQNATGACRLVGAPMSSATFMAPATVWPGFRLRSAMIWPRVRCRLQ